MTKLSYPEAPLAYTDPLEDFPPRSFPRVLMSTRQYYRWLKANPFYRGYSGYGAVAARPLMTSRRVSPRTQMRKWDGGNRSTREEAAEDLQRGIYLIRGSRRVITDYGISTRWWPQYGINAYYAWVEYTEPVNRGYSGYGWVAGGDNFRRGRTRFRIVMQ